MPGLLATIPFLFAENAQPASNSWIYFLPVPIIFYFLLIRPQQQQDRQRRQMLETMKKNDRVLTAAGIYGTVVSIDTEHDKVVLRVDDDRGVKLAFSKGSIVRVIDSAQEKEKAADQA